MINRNQLTDAFINNQLKARRIETILLIAMVFSLKIIGEESTFFFSLLNISSGEIYLSKTNNFTITSRLIAYVISFRTTILAGKVIGFSETKCSLFLGGLALASGFYEVLRLLIYFFSSFVLYQIYVDIPLFVIIADWLSFRHLKVLSQKQNSLLTEETNGDSN
jgi:hypothetical protein